MPFASTLLHTAVHVDHNLATLFFEIALQMLLSCKVVDMAFIYNNMMYVPGEVDVIVFRFVFLLAARQQSSYIFKLPKFIA